MAKTKLNETNIASTIKSRNPIIEFDKLQMYCGEPYIIDIDGTEGKVTINQPSMHDIIKVGEKKFFSTLNIFITNTTSYRMFLWDCHIDWNDLSDFELFTMLYPSIDKEISSMIFDIDFENFKLYTKSNQDNSIPEKKIMYDDINKIEIDENVYNHFCQYLRTAFNTFPEEKITNDSVMKQWYINKDKRQAAIDLEKAKNGEKETSSLQSIISACVNHPGFKYKLDELEKINVCQFYDSVKRLQVYENSTAVMKGMYSGFVDGSKINANDYNFMRNI